MPAVKQHAHYSALLERHLDGELSSDERNELFDHLETCSDCQRVLEAEERLLARLREIPRLVAPSDLRARILQQAVREQFENTHALSEDGRFAPLFSSHGEPLDEEDDVPRFESIPVRRPSRLRKTWKRWSPAVGTSFLTVGCLTALLTADFSYFPMLERTQAALRRTATTAALLVNYPVAKPVPEQQAEPDALPVEKPPSKAVAQTSAWIAGYLAGRFDDISNKVQRFTAAAAGVVPQPAEGISAKVAAVVIRRTDQKQVMSFEEDVFGDTVVQFVDAEPNSKVAGEDRFAFAGHRYHCYTIEMSERRIASLVENLKKFRAPTDPEMIKILREQGRGNTEAGEIAFFSGNDDELRSTLSGLAAKGLGTTDGRRSLDIVVVD